MVSRFRSLTPWLLLAMVASAAVAVLGITSIRWEQALIDSRELTGYSLLATLLLLALFNIRKRLSASPLFSARAWLRLHVVFGIAAVFVFAFHTRSLWPEGPHEQLIAVLFYLVSVSGLLGFVLQRQLPKQLAQIPEEFIYERLPTELAAMRNEIEAQILQAARETHTNTLGRHYVETLSWYFERPRFVIEYLLGTRRGEAWLNSQMDGIARYLDEAELRHLEIIRSIGLRKTYLDAHYAIQSVLKLWVFAHVPVVGLLLLLSLWHLLIVNIYAL